LFIIYLAFQPIWVNAFDDTLARAASHPSRLQAFRIWFVKPLNGEGSIPTMNPDKTPDAWQHINRTHRVQMAMKQDSSDMLHGWWLQKRFGSTDHNPQYTSPNYLEEFKTSREQQPTSKRLPEFSHKPIELSANKLPKTPKMIWRRSEPWQIYSSSSTSLVPRPFSPSGGISATVTRE
jgi:hypothetical protein